MGRQAIDEIDGLLAELTERAASGEQRGAVEALGDLVLLMCVESGLCDELITLSDVPCRKCLYNYE